MAIDLQSVHSIILHIADFFYFMSDNAEKRLYYVAPIQQASPYAYQHSAIRDVATISDILDIVKLFKEKNLAFPHLALPLFEEVVKNTLQFYHELYQKEEFSTFPDGNIGDVGFFLLALEKCRITFPSSLPKNWKVAKLQLIELMLERQRTDGSMEIFFDPYLKKYEKDSEVFYLPEVLIGLIATLGDNHKALDDQITANIQRAIAYCCQEHIRLQHLTSETATFYANWQFQLLYRWIQKKSNSKHALEAQHLEKLLQGLQKTKIAMTPFGSNAATVEVACYLEGIVHARHTLKLLTLPTSNYDVWFDKEITRSIQFLYELQNLLVSTIHGGFVHYLGSAEARIDVAGHVFGGLSLLLNISSMPVSQTTK